MRRLFHTRSRVLPMITPIFFFNLVNQTIGAFQAFNSSYLITQGKPLNTTLYYGVHLYNRAFTYYEMGYGSAMAWFMLLVIAAFTALIFRSSSAWVLLRIGRKVSACLASTLGHAAWLPPAGETGFSITFA